ncbi:MAG: hypothetical protein ABJE10_22960, partial [bacterium]
MTLASIGRAFGASEPLTSADSGPSQTDASATRFAALLAGAMEPKPVEHVAPVKKEATSERDADATDTTDEPTETSKPATATNDDMTSRLGGAA